MKKMFSFVILVSLFFSEPSLFAQETVDLVREFIRASYADPDAYSIVGISNFKRIHEDPVKESETRVLSDDMTVYSKTPLSSTSMQMLSNDAILNLATRVRSFVQYEVGSSDSMVQNGGESIDGKISHGVVSIIVQELLHDMRQEYSIRFTATNAGTKIYAAIMRFSVARPSKEEMLEIAKSANTLSQAPQPQSPFTAQFVSDPGTKEAELFGGFFGEAPAAEQFVLAAETKPEQPPASSRGEPASLPSYTEFFAQAKELYTFTKGIIDADQTYQFMIEQGRRIISRE